MYVHLLVFYIICLLTYVKYVYVLNIFFAFLVNTTISRLSRVDNFTINSVANLFVHERLKIPEAYSEPSRTFKMELFAKIFRGKKPLTTFAKSSIVDVRLDSQYVSASFPAPFYTLLVKAVSRGKKSEGLGAVYLVRSWPNGVFHFVKTNRLYKNGFIPPVFR